MTNSQSPQPAHGACVHGKCKLKPACEHACANRVQNVLQQRDDDARALLRGIGSQIGYGNAQHILGGLWDQDLMASYGVGGRGGMGVTATEREAFQRGWAACMEVWADHMKRMAKAVERKRPPFPGEPS